MLVNLALQTKRNAKASNIQLFKTYFQITVEEIPEPFYPAQEGIPESPGPQAHHKVEGESLGNPYCSIYTHTHPYLYSVLVVLLIMWI